MTHIMIDIETMGQKSNAAIASIGAVLFDPHSNWIGNSFHTHVSLESCQRFGLKMDVSTVLWWLAQSDDARKSLTAGQIAAPQLPEALAALANFIPLDAVPWCNGASFDFPILGNAYAAVDKALPWAFYKERCYRTLKNLNQDIKLQMQGTAHNALDDAIHQARHVQRIFTFNQDTDA